MHLSSWTTSVALFAGAAKAFYPYSFDSGKSSTEHARRFFPWFPDEGDKADVSLTLDIKKHPTQVVKRDNQFAVVLADHPSMVDSLAINQDGSDYSYFATMTFGSKKKELWMLIDTGAANTWVMSSDCKTDSCSIHDTFGPSDSDSLNVFTTNWSVTYGSGNVSGVLANDEISFAGFDVELGFGLANNASKDFSSYPFDGILGLGRPNSDNIGTETIMQVLSSQKLLKANVLGVHLSRNEDGAKDGQITFGGIDSSKFTGDLSYTQTVSGGGLWELPVDGCAVGGDSAGLTGRTAIIDTGTSWLLMPPTDAEALHAKITGSKKSGENYQIPCDTSKPVQFTFSGKTYDVSPKDYVGHPIEGNDKMCNSNIIGHQAFGAKTWLLGAVFLKNVYSVFDFDQNRVGFAPTSAPAATATTSSAVPTPTLPTVKSLSPSSTNAAAASPSSGGSSSSNSSSSSGSALSSSSGSSTSSSNSPAGTSASETQGLGSAASTISATGSLPPLLVMSLLLTTIVHIFSH